LDSLTPKQYTTFYLKKQNFLYNLICFFAFLIIFYYFIQKSRNPFVEKDSSFFVNIHG